MWQTHDDIFLSQGKYTIDILRRFGMMGCKSMATPMDVNMKKLRDYATYLDFINPTMYHQLIGSYMYLVNTGLGICFAVGSLT